MQEIKDYYNKHPLELIIRTTIGGLCYETSTLEDIRDAVTDLAEEALGLDRVSRELLRQIAARELQNEFKLPEPLTLLDAAFNQEEE